MMASACFKSFRINSVIKGELSLFKRNCLLNYNRDVTLNRALYFHTSLWTLTKREHPFKRTVRIFADEFRDLKKFVMGQSLTPVSPKFPSHCDILIIGGGVMGFSVAYWLKKRALDGLKIVVVEKDPSVNYFNELQYLQSTTALSVGGIRQQFSLKENIELSLYSSEFLRDIQFHLGIEGRDPPDINFNPAGYLFLASEESAQIILDNVKLQTSLGAKVEVLKKNQLKEKFPWMNTDGIELASHGLENEGWFDPWSLLEAFKRKSLSLGVENVCGEVTNFRFEEKSIVNLLDLPREAFVTLPNGEERSITFAICIIAAGGLSGHVGKLIRLGEIEEWPRCLPLPITPRKRYVHVVHCPDGPGFKCPFLIDSSGAYLRREGIGGNYICGMSPSEEDEPSIDNLDVDEKFFEEKVWPVIANRVPAFEKCKLKNSWAGFYDFNNFDENAFVGPHPSYYNIFLVTGFSGHGIQQAPAIGRAVMEVIIDGEFKTIDLTRLGYKRYVDNKPLWESNIV